MQKKLWKKKETALKDRKMFLKVQKTFNKKFHDTFPSTSKKWLPIALKANVHTRIVAIRQKYFIIGKDLRKAKIINP